MYTVSSAVAVACDTQLVCEDAGSSTVGVVSVRAAFVIDVNPHKSPAPGSNWCPCLLCSWKGLLGCLGFLEVKTQRLHGRISGFEGISRAGRNWNKFPHAGKRGLFTVFPWYVTLNVWSLLLFTLPSTGSYVHYIDLKVTLPSLERGSFYTSPLVK